MKGLKVFVACFLGALIGSLVANQLIHSWLIGMMAGGLVGYLSYNVKEMVRAVRTSWDNVVSWRPHKPNPLKYKLLFLSLASGIVMGFYAGIFIFAICLTKDDHLAPVKIFIGAEILMFLVGLLSGCGLFVNDIRYIKDSKASYEDKITEAKKFIAYGNPLAFIFYWPAKKSFETFKKIPAGVKKTRLFLKDVFFVIHSDIRLLCGVDAAIGTYVGYLSGNALIGAFAGGILGVLNYYLISIKLLKLVPEK
jgi:hypothetical protein